VTTLRAALDESRRDALVALAERLATEIDASTTARDRLPLVRSFLATVNALEALDNAALRAARAQAGTPVHVDPDGTARGVDELLARRKARHERRVR